jgi:hypothetical protein
MALDLPNYNYYFRTNSQLHRLMGLPVTTNTTGMWESLLKYSITIHI